LGFVTITHPHHPLRGQRVQIIRIRRGVDPDLIVRLPDGSHAAIAMSGTDYAQLPSLAVSAGSPPLLALEGLRQAAQFVAHLRQEGRSPRHAEGEHQLPSPPSPPEVAP
jgi:hypothetical protein